VDTRCAVDSDGDVDMEWDGDDDQEEDEEEKDVDEEKDEDEDDGKEPWTIGQGEIVNISADDVDLMVDNQPITLHDQAQEMGWHTPRPQPRAPAPLHQTP